MEKKIGMTLAERVRAEEQVRIRRLVLRELIEERFGALSAELLQRIESCEDVGRLQAAARQILRLDKLDDLQL